MVLSVVHLVASWGPELGRSACKIEEERGVLLEKEKTDSRSDVFSPGSTATNRIHSHIAEDHFDCVWNISADDTLELVCNHKIPHSLGRGMLGRRESRHPSRNCWRF